jgi:hypothetical protein
MYLLGFTADGTRIQINDDPYAVKRNSDPRVLFDGEEVEVTSISRYRDGGTTVIETERGRLVAHRRVGEEPWDEFEDERLKPEGPLSTFAAVMTTDGITFVRLPDGRWTRLEPEQVLMTDVSGGTVHNMNGPPLKNEAHREVAAKLEHALQQARIRSGL